MFWLCLFISFVGGFLFGQFLDTTFDGVGECEDYLPFLEGDD